MKIKHLKKSPCSDKPRAPQNSFPAYRQAGASARRRGFPSNDHSWFGFIGNDGFKNFILITNSAF